MPRTRNGNFDVIDQTQQHLLSGGAAADAVATTTFASKTTGNICVWSAGNIIDTGIPASSLVTGSGGTGGIGGTSSPPTPILDSATGQPILTDDGQWIFPG